MEASMSLAGSAMCVHRAPRGPLECATSLMVPARVDCAGRAGSAMVLSAPGEVFGDLRVVAGLGPEDDLAAPRIAERAAVAVELAPVVVAPEDGGAELLGGGEDAGV